MNKKNIFILSVTLLSSLFLCIGCVKSDTSENSSNKPDTAEEILNQALALYSAEPHRGTETIYHSYYEDETITEDKEQIIYDSENQIIKSHFEYDDGNTYDNILTVGDNTIFSYIKDSTIDDNWVRFAEIADADNETSYDYTLNELDFSISEQDGYSNIKITEDGTDTLNGKPAIKINISAELAATDGSDNASDAKVTREDIISENDWTKESVMAIDGFSQLLDDYVKYLNKSTSTPDTVKEEYTIWIDESSLQLLQLEGTIYPSYSEETLSDVEEEFWNRCWEVSWIQSDLDSGIPLEDAIMTFEDQKDSIEAQMQAQSETLSPDDDKELLLTKQILTRIFLTGDSCPSIELPADYSETTQEDYYNEYSEDAYLDEEYLEEDFSNSSFLTEEYLD